MSIMNMCIMIAYCQYMYCFILSMCTFLTKYTFTFTYRCKNANDSKRDIYLRRSVLCCFASYYSNFIEKLFSTLYMFLTPSNCRPSHEGVEVISEGIEHKHEMSRSKQNTYHYVYYTVVMPNYRSMVKC